MSFDMVTMRRNGILIFMFVWGREWEWDVHVCVWDLGWGSLIREVMLMERVGGV